MKATEQLKKCKGCNIKFIPKDGRQKFHSPECRAKYYESHYGGTVFTKTCPNCGTSFTTTKPKKQVYCCADCREQARISRQNKLMNEVTTQKQSYLAKRYAALQNHNFRCVFCGRSVEQGAVLDVVEEQGELKPVCLDCRAGKSLLE